MGCGSWTSSSWDSYKKAKSIDDRSTVRSIYHSSASELPQWTNVYFSGAVTSGLVFYTLIDFDGSGCNSGKPGHFHTQMTNIIKERGTYHV